MWNVPHLHRYVESGYYIIMPNKKRRNYITHNIIKYVLKLQEGLKNVFDEAIIAAMEPPPPPKKSFCKLI